MYDLKSQGVSWEDLNIVLQRFSDHDVLVACALREQGRALDRITHGDGNVEEQLDFLNASLPQGLTLRSTLAGLGEHTTKALGAHDLLVRDEEKGNLGTIIKSGSGTSLTLFLNENAHPSQFGLFAPRNDDSVPGFFYLNPRHQYILRN